MATFRSWSALVGTSIACTCSATAAQSASRWQTRQVQACEALSDATRNLCRQVFRKDPVARLLVSYAHTQESGTFLGRSSMAGHLHQLSGIDPLTVEQTVFLPHQADGDDH